MTRLPYKLECKRPDQAFSDTIAAFDVAIAATAYMEECAAVNPGFLYRVMKGRKLIREVGHEPFPSQSWHGG